MGYLSPGLNALRLVEGLRATVSEPPVGSYLIRGGGSFDRAQTVNETVIMGIKGVHIRRQLMVVLCQIDRLSMSVIQFLVLHADTRETVLLCIHPETTRVVT